MNKIDWEVFKKTDDYQNLSHKSKQALAHLYLENFTLSEESVKDFISLDKGEISAEEFKAKAIKRATDNNN